MIMAQVFTLVVCAANIILWIIYCKIRKIKNIKGGLVPLVLITFFALQTSAAFAGIEMFDCINLNDDENPIYFLRTDLDMKCWEGSHNTAVGLGVALSLIWMVVFPLSIFMILKKKNTQEALDSEMT